MVAKSFSEIDAFDVVMFVVVVMFALIVVVFDDQDERFKTNFENVISEMFAVPYEMTTGKADDFIEIDGRMFDRTINAATIGVQMCTISDLKFGTGFLNRENLARSKIIFVK